MSEINAPTPWKMDDLWKCPLPDGGTTIRDADGKIIIQIDFPLGKDMSVCGPTVNLTERIVKCVNAHYDLVEALKFYADEKTYVQPYRGYGEGNETRQEVQKDHGKIAREALAKAGEA